MLLAREGVITGSDLPPDVTAAWTAHGTGGPAGLGSLADDWPTLAILPVVWMIPVPFFLVSFRSTHRLLRRERLELSEAA